MLGPPIAIAVLTNRSNDRRAFMAMALIDVHRVAVSVLGVLLVGY